MRSSEQQAVQYHPAPMIQVRDRGDEILLFNSEGGVVVLLNSTGAEIWRFFSEGRTAAEVVIAVMESYQVDAREAEEDVLALLSRLTDEGWLLPYLGTERR